MQTHEDAGAILCEDVSGAMLSLKLQKLSREDRDAIVNKFGFNGESKDLKFNDDLLRAIRRVERRDILERRAQILQARAK